MIGQSQPMRELRQLISRVSRSESAVLIVGESGSGKELVAEAIHNESNRRNGPFVAINCAALPPSLVEAELFGYTKGGFSGAMHSHAGIFERACGGTVFLDEITEMPVEMQSCLLRVLESRRVTRLGSATETKIDVRIIAATNRKPTQAFEEGRMREDIFYRLAVFPVYVPALRQRGNDVQLLIDHFLQALNVKYGVQKRASSALRQQFQSHTWPGNVRELANAMERAFVLAEQELAPLALEFTHAPASSGQATAPADGTHHRESIALPVGTRLAYAERLLIESTLRHFSGNRQQTAAVLGCSLKTLYNKLQIYRTPTSAQRQTA